MLAGKGRNCRHAQKANTTPQEINSVLRAVDKPRSHRQGCRQSVRNRTHRTWCDSGMVADEHQALLIIFRTFLMVAQFGHQACQFCYGFQLLLLVQAALEIFAR